MRLQPLHSQEWLCYGRRVSGPHALQDEDLLLARAADAIAAPVLDGSGRARHEDFFGFEPLQGLRDRRRKRRAAGNPEDVLFAKKAEPCGVGLQARGIDGPARFRIAVSERRARAGSRRAGRRPEPCLRFPSLQAAGSGIRISHNRERADASTIRAK